MRSLGLLFAGVLFGTLAFSLSVPLIWPQLCGMIALLVLFAIDYVSVQRQDIERKRA
jgi:ABC-2 type transport system permease protein